MNLYIYKNENKLLSRNHAVVTNHPPRNLEIKSKVTVRQNARNISDSEKIYIIKKPQSIS